MGANVNVTYSDMEAAAKQLLSGKGEIESKLTHLKAGIDDLVNNGYVTDKSSKAFHTSYTEFNTGMGKAIEGLHGMSSYLTAAAKALAETDEHLAAALHKS